MNFLSKKVNPPVNIKNNRDIFFDALRGITIIAVVAIHTINSNFLWKYPDIENRDFLGIIVYRQLFLFAVPMFLFISGYWLSQKNIRTLNDYKNFLTKRLTRILIPYLFWSVLFLGYSVLRTHKFDSLEIIYKLLTGGATIPYYFIILLAQLYVLTPVLQYIIRKSYGLSLILLFNIVTLFALYSSKIFGTIGYLPAFKPFYSWVIFYAIGLWVGYRKDKTYFSRKIEYLIFSAIFFSLLISEVETIYLLIKYPGQLFSAYALKYSSFVYSACVILGFLAIRDQVTYWPNLLVVIGRYSFGIFLIHMPVIMIVATIIQKIGNFSSYQVLYQPAVASISLFICCIFIAFIQKLLPKSFCEKVLGF